LPGENVNGRGNARPVVYLPCVPISVMLRASTYAYGYSRKIYG
jgi:hypothetical protein